MATVTPNFNWPVPTSTDLVKDGATAIEALGDSIDASLVDLKGGTTGQVLSKTTNTDMDFTWVTTDDANAIQNSIVDAKGDLIAASANDTPARLAVGANGQMLVADSSTTTGLRYQVTPTTNPVINGAYDIFQRGTSTTVNNAWAFVADRWMGFRSSSCTYSQQPTNDTTNLPNIQSCIRLARTAGDTNTGTMNLQQSVETRNAIPFAGQTVTFSFWARAGANYSATSNLLGVFLYTGTGTDQNIKDGYTGSATPINTTVTLTTTWQRFQVTGTIATTATEFAPYFTRGTTGTAGAADFCEITGVMISLGSIAPSFNRSGGTIQGELAACQRYYWRQTQSDNAYGIYGFGAANSTTKAHIFIKFPSTLRVSPSALEYSTLTLFDGITLTTVTAAALLYSSKDSTGLDITVASGLTQYRPYELNANNSTSSYIAFNAEL